MERRHIPSGCFQVVGLHRLPQTSWLLLRGSGAVCQELTCGSGVTAGLLQGHLEFWPEGGGVSGSSFRIFWVYSEQTWICPCGSSAELPAVLFHVFSGPKQQNMQNICTRLHVLLQFGLLSCRGQQRLCSSVPPQEEIPQFHQETISAEYCDDPQRKTSPTEAPPPSLMTSQLSD